jgi:hypothetical protein
MRAIILALTLSGLAQLASATDNDDYTRWIKVDKVAPQLWRATCYNETRNVDPTAEYETRAFIQPPYFTANDAIGSGVISRGSPRVSQSGQFTPTGQKWEYLAVLKGRAVQQTISFTFTMPEDFDVLMTDYSYVLCGQRVVNTATGLAFPSADMIYRPRQ